LNLLDYTQLHPILLPNKISILLYNTNYRLSGVQSLLKTYSFKLYLPCVSQF